MNKLTEKDVLSMAISDRLKLIWGAKDKAQEKRDNSTYEQCIEENNLWVDYVTRNDIKLPYEIQKNLKVLTE